MEEEPPGFLCLFSYKSSRFIFFKQNAELDS